MTDLFHHKDDSIDVFPVAFLHIFFGAGGLPSIDLANVSVPHIIALSSSFLLTWVT